MSDDTHGSTPGHAVESAEFSRRGLFRGAAILIGGAAALVAVTVIVCAVAIEEGAV